MRETDLGLILTALRTIRLGPVSEEVEVHRAIGDALTAAGIAHQHEARLGPRCRIDFLVGRVGIEVKKGRPARRDVNAQVRRYSAFDQISALILVMEQGTEAAREANGKPVYYVSLAAQWGIAAR